MADEDKKTDAEKAQSTETPTPPPSQGGEVKKEETETEPAGLPEKFKGKSPEEIAKSYLELEKEHGKQSASVGEMRKKMEQWEALGNVIKSSPTLYKAVEDEINRLSGQGTQEKKETKRDDTRIALENTIIGSFEQQFGINTIPAEKKQELHKKIGQELTEMLDPGGTKTPSEILESIPLDKLPRYLEKAYRLATVSDEAEKARLQAYVEAKQNNEAAIGSIPSSGVKGETISLTPQQREVARKMGISETDYIKNLKALEEGK